MSIFGKKNPAESFDFKWYPTTSEKDLNVYFRDILESVQNLNKEVF